MDGPTRAAIPHDRRLALVADADRGEGAPIDTGLTQRDPDAGTDTLEDLVGVVLDPARTRRDLSMLELVAGDDLPGVIEQEASTAGRPLVDGGNEEGRRATHVCGW